MILIKQMNLVKNSKESGNKAHLKGIMKEHCKSKIKVDKNNLRPTKK